MLNFTESMKRIIRLAEASLVHEANGDYPQVQTDLEGIKSHTTEAQDLLEKFLWIKSQGGISAEGWGL